MLLAFFFPFMVMISLLIRLDGGPALFRQERVGQGGKSFLCLKFRTMVINADETLANLLKIDPKTRLEWELTQKLANDPRITKIGKFLRISSLDELPQLINVLRGEMSVVGPRPVRPDELARYGKDSPWYLMCRPGITGLWQVSGRNKLSYADRIALDREYANHRSMTADLIILYRTLHAVVSREGAS
jgi:undecaprenyl-phosphate galactose phosphotransferase